MKQRLIDANALIKEITEARCVNCDRRKGMKKGKMTFVYEIGEVPCRACDVMDMIDALDEAPTVATDTNVLSNWISVKDRLPKETDNYLTLTWFEEEQEYGYDVITYDISTKKWLKINMDFRLEDVPNVKYWMPLPEPPEEVSGDAL